MQTDTSEPRPSAKDLRRKHFEILLLTRQLNRLKGLCECGAIPAQGVSIRGKRYVKCTECLDKRRAREARRRAEVKALPDEIRRYAGNGRHPFFRDLALSMYQVEQEQAQREARAAEPAFPKLTDKRRAFVQKYVELGASWGAGERAALLAGYGKISAAQGGRAASVHACNLLKRPDVLQAIREYQARLARDEQLRREAERREQVRAETARLIEALKPLVSDRGKQQSGAARLLRRLQGQAMQRIPGRCVCGEPVTEGYASCEPCRVKHRDYRRAEQARKKNQVPGGALSLSCMERVSPLPSAIP